MKHRGVVVEIAPKNQVIVMTSRGEFVKVPFKKHVQVGQEIVLAQKGTPECLAVGSCSHPLLALVGTWPLLSEQWCPPPSCPPLFLLLTSIPVWKCISADQKVLAVEASIAMGRIYQRIWPWWATI